MAYQKIVLENEIYLLPPEASAIMHGDRLAVYLGEREIEYNKFKVSSITSDIISDFTYLLPMSSSQNFLAEQYSSIAAFLKKNKEMTYLKFDNNVCKGMVLFSFLPRLDFEKLDYLLHIITKTMPFMLNIFVRPVIHLSREEKILPVDAVKRINRNTVQHILRHTENWKNIEGGEIRPSRLLTEVYEDDYTIYENKVFYATVNDCLALIRNYKSIFTDIIYNRIVFELSMVDKTNHLYHYLALGKLYVGFVKSDQLFAEKCDNYVHQFDVIHKKLSGNRVRQVYRKNRKSKIARTITKTNILAMHKDYRHIYTLKTVLDKSEEVTDWKAIKKQGASLEANYQNFVHMLSVFSIAHFGFSATEDKIYSASKFLGAEFGFNKWNVSLKTREVKCLNVTATLMSTNAAGKTVSTLFIPVVGQGSQRFFSDAAKWVSREVAADRYIFFTATKSGKLPTYHSGGSPNFGVLPVSINDINSFKRIQRVLLEDMIRASEKLDICPFCESELERLSEHQTICKTCRMEFLHKKCGHCDHDFLHTSVAYPSLKEKVVDINNYSEESLWKYISDKDAHLNYRNITDLTADGKPICPHCDMGE